MIEALSRFVEQNTPFFNVVHAASSTLSLIVWLVALPFLLHAFVRGRIASVKMAGIEVKLREAIVAGSYAIRQRDAKNRKPGERSQPTADLAKLNAIIERAFTPADQANLVGKAILWVDDNPSNNESEATALRKIGLVVDQVLSTDAGMAALSKQSYDLVISDMGRGADKFAGYTLLEQIRAHQNPVPFILYSAEGSKPEHRAAAKQRSALGSTDYPHELLEMIVTQLGG